MNLLHPFFYSLDYLLYNKLFVSGLIADSPLFSLLVIVPSKYCRQVAFYTGPTGMNLECIINFGDFSQ